MTVPYPSHECAQAMRRVRRKHWILHFIWWADRHAWKVGCVAIGMIVGMMLVGG